MAQNPPQRLLSIPSVARCVSTVSTDRVCSMRVPFSMEPPQPNFDLRVLENVSRVSSDSEGMKSKSTITGCPLRPFVSFFSLMLLIAAVEAFLLLLFGVVFGVVFALLFGVVFALLFA